MTAITAATVNTARSRYVAISVPTDESCVRQVAPFASEHTFDHANSPRAMNPITKNMFCPFSCSERKTALSPIWSTFECALLTRDWFAQGFWRGRTQISTEGDDDCKIAKTDGKGKQNFKNIRLIPNPYIARLCDPLTDSVLDTIYGGNATMRYLPTFAGKYLEWI